MTRRWGKAGVRLTAAQAADRDRRNAANREARKRSDAEAERVAHEKWRMGLVIPAHITWALDSRNLEGPDVDIACGAREPEVDLWEAGKLYPRWDQIVKLAELTHVLPVMFMAPIRTLSVFETSMRFHCPPGVLDPLPMHRFTHSALVKARLIGVDAL